MLKLPGAECLDYWILAEKNGIVTEEPEGLITIPETLEPGSYTLFWVWNFTEFWYSSCADIDVHPANYDTRRPTKSPSLRHPTKAPVHEGPDSETIQKYLKSGCSELVDPDLFCRQYSGLGHESSCENEVKDDCGRSSCQGLDRSLLIDCPPCGPPGCLPLEPFYDDFAAGIDSNKWLIVHKSWGTSSDGSFKNGGVVYDNVHTREGNVILEAHGSLYT